MRIVFALFLVFSAFSALIAGVFYIQRGLTHTGIALLGAFFCLLFATGVFAWRNPPANVVIATYQPNKTEE
jgi:hypothetical protein